MERWLARFSFSFFILAMVLVREIYNCLQGRRGIVPAWRIGLYCIATVMLVTRGALGVRARHRRMDQER